MPEPIGRRIAAFGLLVAGCALLSSCFLSPGKFASTLELRRDGTFAFTYEGEIQTLALSKLAELAAEDGADFEPACYSDDFEETECSEAEIAEQRAEWEAGAETRSARSSEQSEMMKAMLAGIDPSSPDAAEEFAALLARQKGWDKVEYRGEGLYEISARFEGRLDHGFVFPLVEQMPALSPFVTVIPRVDNRVRVDAPAFARQSDDNPLSGMSGMTSAARALGAANADGAGLPFAQLEGTFRIVTDGRILANNTDEGPSAHPRGQALDWTVSPRTTQPPMALIAFD